MRKKKDQQRQGQEIKAQNNQSKSRRTKGEKPKKHKKQKGFLQYLNPKEMETEIIGYGYQYSLKSYLITLFLSLAVVVAVCRFFQLTPKYMAILIVIFCFSLPVIIVDQFRFLYEQKRFRQSVDYMEQMIYSFKRKPKILESLRDVLSLSDGKMAECLNQAIEAINRGDSYEDALLPIENEYGCERMKILHDFLIKVERQGGKYQSTLNIILDDIHSWTERTYSFQKDRKVVKNSIIISLVMGVMITATTVILFSRNKSMSPILKMEAYQIGSFLVLGVMILLFAFVQKKLTGSWLEDIHDTNEKQIDKDWKNFRKERNVGKEIMQSVFATLICSGPVIIFGLWQSSKIFIIGGIVLAIVIFFVPTGNGNAAKKRLIKECEKEFPGWIRGIALGLQTDNVYMSLRNSAPNAPYVFRNEIYKLLDEIEKDPTGILPYQHFLEDLEVPDIHSIVKMLYSLNEVGSDDAETQINSLIVRNNALIEKAERLKDADKVKLVKQITWLPMLTSTAKIFLDMGLLIMFLFQMMGKLQ